MKRLAEIRDSDFGWTDGEESEYAETRSAARAVMLDERGRVGLMWLANKGVYKLPGGGVDGDESIEESLHREVIEEAGYEVEIEGEVGEIKEWRYRLKLNQLSFCYLVKAQKYVGNNLMDDEVEDGFELRWFDDIDAAIDAVKKVNLDDVGYAEMFFEARELKFLEAAKEIQGERTS